MLMAGSEKRKREHNPEEEEEDELDSVISTKLAASRASPSVVGIMSLNLPDNMAEYTIRSRKLRWPKEKIEARGGELVFWGSGIIIECEEDLTSRSYSSIIIAPATLFIRTNGDKPEDIQVDVYLWDGKVCGGKVVACDFHYNIAAIQIETSSPLPIAALKELDDVVPIYPTEELQLKSFQMPPHTNLFKISPRTKIVTLARTFEPLNAHLVGHGVFWATSSETRWNCNELYWVKDSNHPEKNGGAVLNLSGEVIGLMFYDSPFLPINVVSNWWKHFKSCRQYCRPWLGVEVVNLHSACFTFLEEFIRKFPNVAAGVVVTKVAEESPAYHSGIRPRDVIVNCDGKVVRSTLEFFDIVWNRVGGEPVEFNVVRMSDGEAHKLSLSVGDIAPDKFYQWPRLSWKVFRKAEMRPILPFGVQEQYVCLPER